MLSVPTGKWLPSPSESADGLSGLANAVHAYLQEIQSYAAVCERHVATAFVRERDGGLEIVHSFEDGAALLPHLESALRQLPSGCGAQFGEARTSASRDAEGVGLPCRTPPDSTLLVQGIIWEGFSGAVSAGLADGGSHVRMNVFLHARETDVPVLPLKTVALALLCHECLVPEVVVRPVPIHPGGRFLGVRDYLQRTMPPNLYASECILQLGAA